MGTARHEQHGPMMDPEEDDEDDEEDEGGRETTEEIAEETDFTEVDVLGATEVPSDENTGATEGLTERGDTLTELTETLDRLGETLDGLTEDGLAEEADVQHSVLTAKSGRPW